MAHAVCHLGEKSTSELLSLNDDIHTRPLSSLFHHLLGLEHHPSCVLVFPLSRRIHKTRRQARSPPEARSRIRVGSRIRSMARQHLCTTLQSGRCGGRNQLGGDQHIIKGMTRLWALQEGTQVQGNEQQLIFNWLEGKLRTPPLTREEWRNKGDCALRAFLSWLQLPPLSLGHLGNIFLKKLHWKG